MVAISFGPLLITNNNAGIKLHVLSFFKKIGVVFTIGSLIMVLANISTPISPKSAFGLAFHDMTMAPFAFITALLVLDDVVKGKSKRTRSKVFRIIVFVLCVFCGAMCGSRSAIGAFLIATVIYIMQKSKGGKKIVYIGVSGIFALLIYTTNPFGVLDHFFEKIDRNKDDSSYVWSGRDEMVLDRIDDFKSSPIYGVGFTSMKNISRSKINFRTGAVESGSSWFLILGSTGALGLLFFLLSSANNLIPALKKREKCVLSSCVCFFLVHSMVEGYIISFGAPLCAIFWLLLGLLRTKYDNNSVVE